MKNIYILDAVHTLFRSYFAIGKMTNPKGESTNALYGFIRTVQKLFKDFSPAHFVAVFDGPENKKARVAVYEHYKAHRVGMPEDLIPQLDWAIEWCKLAGIPTLSLPGVEADDVIGCVAKWAERKGAKSYVCSSDKDLCQLVNENIVLLNTYKGNLIIDEKKVKELYDVTPSQIIDYLAIVGDKSDNIPGIQGLGPKAAADLLNKYGTLEGIYEHADEVSGKRGENLITYKKEAYLSQELATLHLNLEIPTSESEYERFQPKIGELTALYEEMRFSSLLREMKADTQGIETESSDKKEATEKTSYHLIESEKELDILVENLSKEQEICVDVETTKLRPLEAELVGVGFAVKPKEAYYVPVNGKLDKELVLKKLRPLFSKCSFYGHNLKYDYHVLLNEGIEIEKICFDTMLASYVLAPQVNRHGLDHLSLHHFGKVKTSIKSLLGTGKKAKSMLDVPIKEVSDYCCEDVDFTCRLKELFEEEVAHRKLKKILYEIEIPLIKILAKMERNGIYLDAEKLKVKSKELVEMVGRLQKEIYNLANEEFNINSPKQLSHILYTKLEVKRPPKKRGTSVGTGAEILKALAHEYPIAEKILEYRGLEKLRSTYVDSLPKQINEKTGRIHCSFNQSVAATGRLSCTDPNLQNIPIRSSEGRKIREAFHPEKSSSSFLAADYSQIELRILAHLSEDPALVKAFNEGEDIHAFTASRVFDRPLDQVTREMRYRAKAVNFGLIYGQGAFGLSQELDISHKEASDFIKKYFDRYPKVRDFLEHCKEEARATKMATTMTGRQRPLPDIDNRNPMIRSQAERLAVNTPFQGTQADIIKMAMIEIDQKIKEEEMMILQIHDELIFEVPDSELSSLEKVVKPTMEGIIKLKVPLSVDISVGKNWGEC
ncbi:MAG: DNA polymerase I [Candidatus Algichlamydia australiensis]|nr:DNA polymerase I [Chlamydiales bacterium]